MYFVSVTLNFRVNCSFFFKIGACRHGERCSRLHNKPTFSQTILLQNLYLNPQNATQTVDKSIRMQLYLLLNVVIHYTVLRHSVLVLNPAT